MSNVETDRPRPRTRRPTTKDLDAEFRKVQADGAELWQQYRRTHDSLYQHFAVIYLWWRKALQQPEYLDAIYEQRGIQYKKTNRPNFTPLLRVVFNIDDPTPTDRNVLAQWNKVFAAMDEHYVANEADFKHNPTGKLAALIKDSGGIGAFAAGSDDNEDEEEGRAGPSERELITPAVHAAVVQRSIEQLKVREGLAQIAITKPGFRVGKDGFLALFGQYTKNGQIIIRGTTNDPVQIENVASSAAEKNLGALPYTLRAQTEVIQSQAFPPHALPSSAKQRSRWFQKEYNEKGEIRESDLPGWSGEGKGKWLLSSKQLRLRGYDAILSGNRISASPVTRVRLREPMIEANEADYYLYLPDRAFIERWLETREIVVLQVEKANSIPPNTTGGTKADNILAVTNPVTKTTKNLHYYRIPSDDQTRFQADFRRDDFTADWTTNVPPSFFQEVRQRWADQWFAELGVYNQIIRDVHATLQVRVTRQAFTILYNLGISSEAFSFPTELEISNEELTSYFSKDLGPVLFNLADAPVTDQITIAGNRHALVITYNTEVGDFEIAVPTLAETKKGKAKRDDTLFCAIGKKP